MRWEACVGVIIEEDAWYPGGTEKWLCAWGIKSCRKNDVKTAGEVGSSRPHKTLQVKLKYLNFILRVTGSAQMPPGKCQLLTLLPAGSRTGPLRDYLCSGHLIQFFFLCARMNLQILKVHWKPVYTFLGSLFIHSFSWANIYQALTMCMLGAGVQRWISNHRKNKIYHKRRGGRE